MSEPYHPKEPLIKEINSTIKDIATTCFPNIEGEIIAVLASKTYNHLFGQGTRGGYSSKEIGERINVAGALVSVKIKKLINEKVVKINNDKKYSMDIKMVEALLRKGYEINPEYNGLVEIINSISK